MQLDMDLLTMEARPFEYKGAKFFIRPFPQSMADSVFSPGVGIVQTGEQRLKMFMHCLTGWEGIVDAEGKDVPCTPENKKRVFDMDVENIPAFVLVKSREFYERKEELEKN